MVVVQSKASVLELYMGRDAPLFTSMRVLPESADDDHLVGLSFDLNVSYFFHGLYNSNDLYAIRLIDPGSGARHELPIC
jgi:hypothetical protein